MAGIPGLMSLSQMLAAQHAANTSSFLTPAQSLAKALAAKKAQTLPASNTTGQLPVLTRTPVGSAPPISLDDIQSQYDQQDALSSRDRLYRALGLQEQTANMNSTMAHRTLDEAHPGALRNLLNQYSGRGMAYSSGYGYGVGETERGFANQASDIDSQRNAALQSVLNGRTDANQSYMDTIQRIKAQAAARLAAKSMGSVKVGI